MNQQVSSCNRLPPVIDPRGDDRYYVYCHVKRTDGRTFYVGKGCDRRAWSVDGRSKEWIKVAVDHGRTVHIVRAGLTEQAAFDLERALIADAAKQGLILVNVQAGGSCCKPVIKKYVPPIPKIHRHHLEDIRQSILSTRELSRKYNLSEKQINSIRRKRRR